MTTIYISMTLIGLLALMALLFVLLIATDV